MFALFCQIEIRWNTCIGLMEELFIADNQVTHSSSDFSGVLPSFKNHFNSDLLISATGVCSEIPCPSVLLILRFNLLVALLCRI